MSTSYQVLVNFNGTNGGNPSNGGNPEGSLIDISNVLYSTTNAGGSENAGTVFAYNLAGGALSSVTSFTTNGTDGYLPQAGLTDVNGTLYGTTSVGGTADAGAIYAYNTTTHTQQTVFSFNGGDGQQPQAPLTDVNGVLYGTTFAGGSPGDGTLFSYDPSTNKLQSLNDFNTGITNKGQFPTAALTDVNGVLYGTTSQGGSAGDGTLFDYNIATQRFQTLVNFSGTDGVQPDSSLTDVNGVLYGTTYSGGTSTEGTLFAYTIANGTLQTLVNFGSPQLETNNNGGINPAAGVTDINGTLYGTTQDGGTAGGGTLYAYDIATGAVQTPINFNTPGFGGGDPSADLLDVNGTLFGTAAIDGQSGAGVLFSFTPQCFVTGTRIATTRGPVAVEALRAGDLIVLADGGTLPVRWVGCRQVACASHADPQSVWPVRIAAGAFGAAGPAHDLYLSPDHAVFIDGALIPAKHLVDGGAVARVACDTVTYWHVELPRHAVLLAEGLACESFLDTRQRRGDYVTRVWEADGCAELVVTGPRLAAARARLSGARAA